MLNYDHTRRRQRETILNRLPGAVGLGVMVGAVVGVVGFGLVLVGCVLVEVIHVCVVTHALYPSLHVCSKFLSPADPHFPSHEPPLPQQLRLLSPVRAHLGHSESKGKFAL